MSMPRAMVVLAASLLGACRHGASTDTGSAAAGDATPVPSTTASTPPPVPAALAGVLHLASGQPAVNLRLFDDGTFEWRYEDCVCVGGGWGTWKPAGAGVVLSPPPEGLTWATLVLLDGGPTTVSFEPAPDRVKQVTIAPGAGGLVATATWSRGGTQAQPWTHGRVCPVCRPAVPGPLPTGAGPLACDDTLPQMHQGPGLVCH